MAVYHPDAIAVLGWIRIDQTNMFDMCLSSLIGDKRIRFTAAWNWDSFECHGVTVDCSDAGFVLSTADHFVDEMEVPFLHFLEIYEANLMTLFTVWWTLRHGSAIGLQFYVNRFRQKYYIVPVPGLESRVQRLYGLGSRLALRSRSH
jgi:hypothetical protein